jgi:hypothetical protein
MAAANVWPGRNGSGDWLFFDRPLEQVFDAAEEWKKRIEGVSHPWLCWNVHPDWCVVQQKLILAIGWTPVIGWDPSLCRAAPPLLPNSIAIDFNERLQLLAMWPHFPMEFAFLWTDKLAFWHADLLMGVEKLQKYAQMFDCVKDGEMSAVLSRGGLKNRFKFRSHRYWEVLGCTTREASKSQFDNGCGWWRHIESHPNCRDEDELRRRRKYYYDHGVGIMYWKNRYNGKIIDINHKDIADGHFSMAESKKYIAAKSKTEELEKNCDLSSILTRFGIDRDI